MGKLKAAPANKCLSLTARRPAQTMCNSSATVSRTVEMSPILPGLWVLLMGLFGFVATRSATLYLKTGSEGNIIGVED